MDCTIAIFDLKGALAPEDRPLMLQSVLFCPVLCWTAQELMDCGVQRCFVVCHPAWQQEVREALPDVPVAFFDDTAAALSAAGGAALLLPGPVLPVGRGAGGPGLYLAAPDAPAQPVDAGALFPQLPTLRPFSSAAELAEAMPDARALLTRRMAERGVTVIDPDNTYVDPRCSVAPGVTLLPGCLLRGRSVIGPGCVIGPNSMLTDCRVGRDTTVNASQLTDSVVGSGTTVGPFAYVRPGCTIGDHCRVGDFVEMKNSVIGDGTKISHLTYVGDSDVGRRVNFGCGTVTTNYDGHKKYRCTVGDDVFLGCNTNLIAPVTVGDRAYTAAGSTVTEDVPAGALAIARSRQLNKEGWADRLRRLWKNKP